MIAIKRMCRFLPPGASRESAVCFETVILDW